MLNKIKKDNKGFTIIEVLIVLAIAGLILLVVFLAVPALQRQSRNTQLKAAVTSVLGGITDFSATYDGTVPTSITTTDGLVTISSSTTKKVEAKINKGLTATLSTGTGDIKVTIGKTCNADGNDVGPDGTARNVAIVYSPENSDGTVTKKCDNG